MGVKAVVLLSGGMDSAIASACARAKGRRLFGLSLDYGQRHLVELVQARKQAALLGFEDQVVLRLPLSPIASGSLVNSGPIRSARAAAAARTAKPATYVSFRNGVFLAAAASYAEALGAGEVWGGWCFTDHAGYPDCTPNFFRAFERAVRLGTWAGRRGKAFRIEAPLGRLDKAASLRLGLRLGVDFSKTWTCYQPAPKGRAVPCGRCDACRLRAQGFAQAGLHDPLLLI
ncbi:MAG: 7-cyano-7-deazaguanine synthase QueC [bacterium]